MLTVQVADIEWENKYAAATKQSKKKKKKRQMQYFSEKQNNQMYHSILLLSDKLSTFVVSHKAESSCDPHL